MQNHRFDGRPEKQTPRKLDVHQNSCTQREGFDALAMPGMLHGVGRVLRMIYDCVLNWFAATIQQTLDQEDEADDA
jgi:hypothetical protein